MATTHRSSADLAAEGRMLRNYIGGEWSTNDSHDGLETRAPASGEVLAHVPMSNQWDVDAAVEAALVGFAEWRVTSPLGRARALFALREAVDGHRDELADLITMDMGKTRSDAYAEVGRGIESIEVACGIPTLLKGETLEGVGRGVDVEMIRQPVGVVAAITPFNFPAMIPLWFLPFAIACGNAIILKPSERDPLTPQRIVELIETIDAIPPGVVNLLHGGRDAVNVLLAHSDVSAVSFVGSASTARHVYETAGREGKRVQALGGAKNSMIVMPDADPDTTLSAIMGSSFGAAGQRCMAGSVAVLVGNRGEQDRARDFIVGAARDLTVGDGARSETDVCPLIDVAARERIESEIEGALRDGISVVLDGRMGGGEGGALLGPTVLDDVPDEHRCAREELFGPVLTLVRQPDLATAVEWIKGGRYGNAAIIFTSSGASARQFRFDVDAGMLGINVGVPAPIAWFPFAGWKDSFAGDLHANGQDAVEFYTRKKVITSRWGAWVA